MTTIFKAVKDGKYYYNKKRYEFDDFGSMFFNKDDLIQHLQYSVRYKKLSLLGVVIVEYSLTEVSRSEVEFKPDIISGETFDEIQ